MPHDTIDAIPAKYRVDEWLVDIFRNTPETWDSIDAFHMNRKLDKDKLLRHVKQLAEHGVLVIRPVNDPQLGRWMLPDVSLPAQLLLDLTVGDLIVDHWRATRGVGAVRNCVWRLQKLLTGHSAAAVAIDPAAAIYTALVCADPDVRRATGHRIALAALEQTTALDGPIDTATLIRTLTSFRDFPGTAEQALGTAVGILT